jgi:hypothetical protein
MSWPVDLCAARRLNTVNPLRCPWVRAGSRAAGVLAAGLSLVAAPTEVRAADIAAGAGGQFTYNLGRHSEAHGGALMLSLTAHHHWEFALHYYTRASFSIARQDWVDQTFNMNPYWAVSVSRRFFFNEGGRVQPFLGAGVLLKPRQKVTDLELRTPITTANVLDPAPVNFHWQLGLQYQRWRLVLRHTSDANLYKPNFGQNVLMIEARLGAL